jgi:hypothetical protein
MAVIREKRQFRVGAIGVARSSRAGVIVGEAIAESAGALSAEFFRRAAEDAQEKGIKSVAELSDQQVLTLGEDGQPQAMKAPLGFGRIATKAREQALLTRFEEELEIELGDKAKEFANKYRKSPEAFKKAMSDYTASMANAEESTVFTQLIQNTGAQLTSNVYHSLQLAAMQRHEAEMAKANDFANSDGLNSYELLYANGQGDAAEKVIAALDARNQNDLKAGYVQNSDFLLFNLKRRAARARGIITHELSRLGPDLSSNELDQIYHGINTGDPDFLPDDNRFNILRETLRSSGEDLVLQNEVKQFALPLVKNAQDRNRFTDLVDAQKRLTAASDISTSEYANIGRSVNMTALQSAIDAAYDEYTVAKKQARTAIQEGETSESVKTYTAGSLLKISSIADGLISRTVADAENLEQLDALRTYLTTGSKSDLERLDALNSAMADRAKMITYIDGDVEEIDFAEKAIQLANSFNDEAGRKNFANQYENFSELEDAIRLDKSNLTANGEPTDKYNNYEKSIKESDLSLEQRRVLEGQLQVAAGRSYLTELFSDVNSSSKLMALETYLITGEEPESLPKLTDEEKSLAAKAKENLDPSQLSGAVSRKVGTISQRLAAEADALEKKQKLGMAVLGELVNNQDNRELVSESLEATAVKLGYKSLVDLFINPNTEGKDIVALKQFEANIQSFHSVPPQALVGVLEQAANGGMSDPNFSMSRVLRFYRAFTDPLNPVKGNTFKSKGLEGALDNDTKAMLDALVIAEMKINPNLDDAAREAALVRIFNDMTLVMENEAFKDNLFEKLDKPKSLNHYVINTNSDYLEDPELIEFGVAALRAEYSRTRATGETFKPQQVLKDVVKNRAMKDERVVTFGSDSTLSPFALDITTNGMGDEFYEYAGEELRRNVVGAVEMFNELTGESEFADVGEYYLSRVGYDTEDKGQTYVVVNKEGVPYQMERPDGEGGKVQHAIFVSTGERGFKQKLKIQRTGAETKAIQEARDVKAAADEFVTTAMKTEAVKENLTNLVEANPAAKTLFNDRGSRLYDINNDSRKARQYTKAYKAIFVGDVTKIAPSLRRQYASTLITELLDEANLKDPAAVLDDPTYGPIMQFLLDLRK